jgi:hypothetical protein
MIGKKAKLEEIFSTGDLNLQTISYRIKDMKETNNEDKLHKNHYKIHLGEIFYKLKGKRIFPDRG